MSIISILRYLWSECLPHEDNMKQREDRESRGIKEVGRARGEERGGGVGRGEGDIFNEI